MPGYLFPASYVHFLRVQVANLLPLTVSQSSNLSTGILFTTSWLLLISHQLLIDRCFHTTDYSYKIRSPLLVLFHEKRALHSQITLILGWPEASDLLMKGLFSCTHGLVSLRSHTSSDLLGLFWSLCCYKLSSIPIASFSPVFSSSSLLSLPYLICSPLRFSPQRWKVIDPHRN